MAIVFTDSFDHYTTAAQAVLKWGAGTTTGVTIGAFGRNSTQGLKIDAGGVSQTTGYVQKSLANLGTSVEGFALRGTGDDRPVCRWMDNATEQCSLWLRSDGRLEARGPGGVLATGTAVISSLVHAFIEVKAVIHASAGRIQVQVNQPAGSTTYDIDTGGGGVDTQDTANAYATAFRLGYGLGSAETASYVYEFDDARIFNTSGSVNDDFGGDMKVECLIPNGAGTSTDFTPSASTNVSNIDDTSPDDDTTYNSSATPGDLDLFALPSLSSASGTVAGINLWAYLRKEDAGSRTVHLHAELSTASTTTQESGDIAPTTGYTFESAPFDEDGDGNAWDTTKIAALEIGYEVEA